MEEIRKKVEWFDYYYVSNLGRLKWKYWIMCLQTNEHWYYMAMLYRHGYRKNCLIHRLVWQAFISNPEDKPQINHKDWNRINNNVSNLEWCNNSENNRHAYRELWRKHAMLWKFWKDNPSSKQTYQYTKDWILLKIWDSARDIEKELWFMNQNISKCCKWIYKTSNWFVWRNSWDKNFYWSKFVK